MKPIARPAPRVAVGLCVLSVLLQAVAGAAGEPAASEGEAAEPAPLVRQLGADDFRQRESAGRQLEELGEPALALLRPALGDADPEVRRRALRLFERIERRVWYDRLERFSSGEEAAPALPGWDRFRELMRSEPQASGGAPAADEQRLRSGFAALARAEPELFRRVGNSARLREALAERLPSLLQQVNDGEAPPAASIAAAVFVAGDPQLEMPAEQLSALPTLISNAVFVHELQAGGASRDLYRRIVAEWLRHRSQGPLATRNFLLALNHDFPEILEPAVAHLTDGAVGRDRLYSLLAVGRFGDVRQVRAVWGCLDDESVVMIMQNGNMRQETQARDVALCVALHLLGLNHEEFGMPRLQTDARMLFRVNTIGFETEAERKHAFERFAAWQQSEAGRKCLTPLLTAPDDAPVARPAPGRP